MRLRPDWPPLVDGRMAGCTPTWRRAVAWALSSKVVFASLLFLAALMPTVLHASAMHNRGMNWDASWYSPDDDFSDRTGNNLGDTMENNTVSNVTVQLGGTAFLHCRVRHMGERTMSSEVTWWRRRDWHILTSGSDTYTNDDRFQVLHSLSSDDWTLQIKYVQIRDNGTYECQVSTNNGIVSHFVNLFIVVPKASIKSSNGNEYHVERSSAISLTCVIAHSPTPPQYVFWYHNQKMINYDTQRGGIAVETEQGNPTTSKLTIQDASESDSGNYTCTSSNTQSASIYVFVSEGDKIAAISRRKTSAGSALEVVFWFVVLPLGALAVR